MPGTAFLSAVHRARRLAALFLQREILSLGTSETVLTLSRALFATTPISRAISSAPRRMGARLLGINRVEFFFRLTAPEQTWWAARLGQTSIPPTPLRSICATG